MSTELSTLSALLSSENIKKRFRDVLGENAAGFMSSILSATNSNPKLKNAEPMSVISAAAVAAALDLPINPSLAYAHIVPYKDVAQFQMGWKGYVQLAQRTGLYLTINVSRVCEGELISENPFTGEINLSHTSRASDKVIGYVAYFKLLNGFEKYLYMTKEQCEKHGKRYSDFYKQTWSWWQKDFDVMAMKTVIKALLSKWGPLSIKMQLALQADQSIIKENGSYEYVDNEPIPETPEKIKKKGIAALKARLGKPPETSEGKGEENKKMDEEMSKLALGLGFVTEESPESKVKQIVLATPEQVAEIIKLIDLIKIDEKEIAKILLKGNVENWTELTQKQAMATVSWLKKKIEM